MDIDSTMSRETPIILDNQDNMNIIMECDVIKTVSNNNFANVNDGPLLSKVGSVNCNKMILNVPTIVDQQRPELKQCSKEAMDKLISILSCPQTGKIFCEPVLCDDGIVYEDQISKIIGTKCQ